MNNFPWVPLFEELSDALLNYEEKQIELIKMLLEHKYYAEGINDKENGKWIPLTEIDPFTFLSIIVKFGFDKRKEILVHLKSKLKLKSDVPDTFYGVPSSQAQNAWYFSFKDERKPEDIKILWKLFKEAVKNKIKNETFKAALNVRGVGYRSLTQALFRAKPNLYYPIDVQSEPFLGKHRIDYSCKNTKNYSDWAKCMSEIQLKFPGKTFCELSHMAWSENQNGEPCKRYWGGGIGDSGDLERWIKDNYWQVNYSKNTEESAGKKAWKSFRKISIGDEFVIRGVGGKKWDDLVCHYYGEVIEKNNKNGILKFKELQKNKYSGKKPKGKGSGNWGLTLNEVTRPEDIKLVFGTEESIVLYEHSIEDKGSHMVESKNIIYYGPPGTGKTRSILELRDDFTSEPSNSDNDEFLIKIVKNLSWWECIACALADIDDWAKVVQIKDHKVIQAKISMQNSKSVNQTLWGQLQCHTSPDNKNVKYNIEKRMEPFIFEKDENSRWKLVEGWNEIVPDVSVAIEKLKKGPVYEDREERFKVVTFHPNFTYEDFILGIRPDTDESDGIKYEKVAGKFKEICDIARRNKHKEYAIFIDEINRGNIPAIFGELITLIEDDKRGIEVEIPNSDVKFSVPENLWIYGTMNTADRSVEALDIALRRRFVFVPKYPEPELLENRMIGKINLQTLLETINDRVEFLKDKDHTIGHSYFLNVYSFDDLKNCFKNKIIPLLEEYFYNDFEKIGLVLGQDFVKKSKKHKEKKNFFASFESDFKDDLDDYEVYYIEDLDEIVEQNFLNIYEK